MCLYSILSGGSDTTGTLVIHDTLSQPGSTQQYPIVSNTFTPPPSSQQATSYAINCVQWYPHDTGMFVTSSADRAVKVWDTNEMCPVESFKFSKPVYTHTMAGSDTHCLIAGTVCGIHTVLVTWNDSHFTLTESRDSTKPQPLTNFLAKNNTRKIGLGMKLDFIQSWL